MIGISPITPEIAGFVHHWTKFVIAGHDRFPGSGASGSRIDGLAVRWVHQARS
jgi:hypothetical protein